MIKHIAIYNIEIEISIQEKRAEITPFIIF